MSRYLVLLLAFNIQGFASIANANDLDKWNSEQGRVVRSELKSKLTTTYTEKPNPLHTDSTYKASENGGKILTRLETKSEIKGSRVGATIEAFKTVDKGAVASKYAKEFAKGGVRFAVGAVLAEMAVREMVNGVGWIIDNGGKVQKKEEPAPNDNSYYKDNTTGLTGDALCFRIAMDGGFSPRTDLKCTMYSSGTNAAGQKCFTASFYRTSTQTETWKSCFPNATYSKPDPIISDVPQDKIEQTIKDYLNDPTKPQNVKDTIIEQAVKPGATATIEWSDDPSSKQTIHTDNKNTAERILNSDNPQGDGLTKTTPVITDGTRTDSETTTNTETNTDVNETTTTNPDGSTTTTGSNTSTGSSTTTTTSKLPAFCDYAAKLCDWLDWTKEMPEDPPEEEKPSINDKGIFNRTFDAVFSLGGECPPDYPFVFTSKYLNGNFTISLNWLCIIFTVLGYALIFLSNCIGLWILYETVIRKEIKW